MSRFRTTRQLVHSPQRMFDLVADVERYPDFVPLCEDIVVVNRAETPEGERLAVDMTVGYKAVRETFRSLVDLDRKAMRITVRSTERPFASLENLWTFAENPSGGCRIDFVLEYRFRSRALQMLMGTMFDKAFSKFAAAFEARADEIYGAPALDS